MSEESESAPHDEGQESVKSNSALAAAFWRVLLFGILGGLLVFAYIRNQDINAINQGIETYNAWQDAIEAADAEHDDVYKDDLAQFVNGNPTVNWDKNPGRQGIVSIETYTWKGQYKEYSIEVHYGLPKKNPSVIRLIEIREE